MELIIFIFLMLVHNADRVKINILFYLFHVLKIAKYLFLSREKSFFYFFSRSTVYMILN